MRPAGLQTVYDRQSAWFAGERSRLLRKVDITSRKRVLDLGAGTGSTLSELTRRSEGLVVGADADRNVLALAEGTRLLAQAQALPFADRTFDLVFTQMFFMWAGPLSGVLTEIRRVLAHGGHLIACAEPDYGAAIEHPAENAVLQELAGSLDAEGADVHVARRLGGEMQRAGFSVTCGTHQSRPLEAAREESQLFAPELVAPSGELEFLFIPYFHFLAVRTR